METLEKRRLKSDLILFYKIHNHQISIESENLQILPNINLSYNLRRHDQLYRLPPLPKSRIRSNFFTNRIIKIWNKLPQELISSKSLLIFKSNLNSLNLSQYTDLVFNF